VPAAAGKSLPPTGDALASAREQVARTASWIDAQPESSYLVQHAVSGRASDLLDLRRSQPALADARIIATFRSDGRVYFALVSGPFDSAADARSFEQGLPKLATPGFVRSISRVKRELVEPTSPNVPGLPPIAR
jgi:septal ring-binding cell division protein DamX